MDYKELTAKKKEDLIKLLKEKRETLKDLQFKAASQELKNVREVRQTRKQIAQILTALEKI